MNRPRGREWTELISKQKDNKDECSVLVTNDKVELPEGLWRYPDFLDENMRRQILTELDTRRFTWEGFDERRKVQSYDLKSSDVPVGIQTVVERFQKVTGYAAQNAKILQCKDFSTRRITDHVSATALVAPFETPDILSDSENSFAAYLPLDSPVVQHLNCPLHRLQSCWRLKSENHWTDMKVEVGDAVIKTGDCLQLWRSKVLKETKEGNCHVLKLWSCGNSEVKMSKEQDDRFGYIPSDKDVSPGPDEHPPPMRELLTIVVTTSPIKSNPSTEMIELVSDTFRLCGDQFAFECPKVIVCDGYRTRDELTTEKYQNVKQAMRNGIVTEEQAENYGEFIKRLRALCDQSTAGTVFNNTKVETLEERQGYGFALRHALRHCVKTRFVCVIQHDRAFMRRTPILEALSCLWRYPGIKYIGINMRSNLIYRDIFRTKFGKRFSEEMTEMILRPPELLVDDNIGYGPNAKSIKLYGYKNTVEKRMYDFMDTYRGSLQARSEAEVPVVPGKTQMSLTPTLFWYDNVHLAEVAFYSDFIFDPSLKMVVRGGFVEDKLSPVMKKTVDRLGLKDGHSRFGCYILDDHAGAHFTGHFDGGSYLTIEERKALGRKDEEENPRG